MKHPEGPVSRPAGVLALAVVLSACSSGGITAVAATTPTSASASPFKSTTAATTPVVPGVASGSAPSGAASAAPSAGGGGAPASAPVASPAAASPAVTSPVVTSPSAASKSSTSGADASGGGAKCTDLTSAAASAALGKSTTVTLDNSVTAYPGLSICTIKIADEVYPVQLSVNTSGSAAGFGAEEQAGSNVKPLTGVGDRAFTSTIGVEALRGNVDVNVIGPAGPVLNGNFKVPTAIAKAMIAALK